RIVAAALVEVDPAEVAATAAYPARRIEARVSVRVVGVAFLHGPRVRHYGGDVPVGVLLGVTPRAGDARVPCNHGVHVYRTPNVLRRHVTGQILLDHLPGRRVVQVGGGGV